MSFEITGTLKLIDEASGAVERATESINSALNEVENASRKVTFTQEQMSKGFKDAVTGISGVATSAWGLYQAYDRLEEMQYQVQRANVAVERAAYQVTVAQEAYNKALEKYGADSEQAHQAAERLRLAQEQYNVAAERAEILQGNMNEAMVQTALMVVPSLITAVEGITKAKQAWAAAQMFLNKVLLANPILLIVAAIGGLVAAVWAAYQHCEWFREAVNKAGEVLYNFFKPAIDAVIGAVKWLADAVNTVWGALTGFANAVGGAFNWLAGTVGAAISAVTGDTDALCEKVEEGSAAAAEAFADAGRKMIVTTEAIQEALPPIISDVFGGIKDAVLNMTGQTEAYYTAWRDESIRIVEENLSAQLREVEARYAEMTRKVDEELQNQLHEITAHYEQLREEENARYEEAYNNFIAHYNAMFTAQETELSRLLDTVNRHYDDEVRKVEDSYNEQINATLRFYDEMLAANEEGLKAIREGRQRDLEDLELNMLLQKQALKEAHEAGLISTEEYNEKLRAIEQEYNEKRRAINDEYRLRELQELKAAREREEAIIAERNVKIAELEAQRTEAVEAVNRERNTLIAEINAEAAALEEEHQRNLTELTAKELAERNAATENAEREKATLIAEQEAEQQRLIEEAEKEKLRIINEYGEKMESASGNWWNSITNAISGACESAKNALSGFVSSVSNAMSGAWDAISNFINSICFAHAIHDAVVSSVKDLAEWNRAVDDAMKRGVESVEGFIGEMAKPVLTVTAEKPGRGAALAPAPASAAVSRVDLHFSAPLVQVEGSADRRTAELAAELIERRLRSVIVEVSSSGAPETHKRIRMEKALVVA